MVAVLLQSPFASNANPDGQSRSIVVAVLLHTCSSFTVTNTNPDGHISAVVAVLLQSPFSGAYFCYRYGLSYNSHINVYVSTFYDSNWSHLVTSLFHIFAFFPICVKQPNRYNNHHISSSHNMFGPISN